MSRRFRPELLPLDERAVPALFTVTNVADAGAGSFRAALVAANTTAGPDRIEFGIPGNGPHVVALRSALPAVADAVVIDGSTQPGVRLDGSAAGAGVDGLTLAAGGSTVRGITIGGFGGNGIVVAGPDAQLLGNAIGTDPAGAADLGNGGFGVLVTGPGATSATVGGVSPDEGNVIGFNARAGVRVAGGAAGVLALGNTFVANGGRPVSLGGAGRPTPVLTSPTAGTLQGAANTLYLVELYAGGRSAGVLPVTTDAAGMAAFTFAPTNPLPAGAAVAATASDMLQGFTSEFFGDANVPPTAPPVDPPPAPPATPPAVPPTVPPVAPPAGPPAVGRTRLTATGADAGQRPVVLVFNPDGSPRFTLLAYAEAFTGGVRVAAGDVTGDGVDDIVTGAGAGGAPHVKVFDGATGAEVRSFFAFDPGFAGGVRVAAGDLTGDGRADVVASAGAGGGPHVKAFDADTGEVVQSFFAFDPGFAGGATVAAGDVTGDGVTDIVVGAGPGGAPHVKVFDGATGEVARSFFAFDPATAGPVRVAVADVTGDGAAEVVAAAGSQERAFDPLTGDVLAPQGVFVG